MNKAANIISVIFHPLVMPLVGFFIIFNSGIFEVNIPSEVLKFTYLVVILFSIFLPLSIIPFLVYWKLAQNIEFNSRQERFAPTFFAALSLVILYIFINQKVPIDLIQAFSFSIACSAMVLLFLNLLFKISMHLMVLGGITGLMAILTIEYSADLFFWLSILIFITGLVSSARLYLKAHKPIEIISGYVIGFLINYSVLFFTPNKYLNW